MDDKLKEALEAFKEVQAAEEDNRTAALDDLKFARLGEQWTEEAIRARGDNRPCLTINKQPAFVRNIINQARQNKPAIKAHPVDDQADPKTAEIIDGIIRNIEYSSNAEVAYDTGLEFAVSMGWGYWRVSLDYAYDDVFDLDLKIDAITNPFSVYGDPSSTKADSSDWNSAFIVESLKQAEFKKRWKGASISTFEEDGYNDLPEDWSSDGHIKIAEYWTRTETLKPIVKLNDGTILDADVYKKNQELFQANGLTIVGDRQSRSYKVQQQIISGAEILETNDWVGKYIPIVPCYGEVVNIEGVRHLRSHIRDNKDPQRIFNYWRTTSTELIALAPKAPWVAEEGATEHDPRWLTANTEAHDVLTFKKGYNMPQRIPFAGIPAGALQESLNASDDMKAITGIFDASLGATGNEKSGKAINARQQASDIGSFHFIDNRNRAIAHTGRIILDLIPHIYTKDRIVRILGGIDGKEPSNITVGQPQPQPDGTTHIFDLTAGRYDLTVEAGPSYASKRDETANQMTMMIQAYPAMAPLIMDILAKNLDWIGADEVAKRTKAMLPPQIQALEQGQNPEVVQLQNQLQQIQQQMQQMQQALEDKSLEAKKVDVDVYNAETNRIKATQPAMNEQQAQALILQVLQQALSDPGAGIPNQPMNNQQQQPAPMPMMPTMPMQPNGQ